MAKPNKNKVKLDLNNLKIFPTPDSPSWRFTVILYVVLI